MRKNRERTFGMISISIRCYGAGWSGFYVLGYILRSWYLIWSWPISAPLIWQGPLSVWKERIIGISRPVSWLRRRTWCLKPWSNLMACGWVPLARPAKEKGFAGIGSGYRSNNVQSPHYRLITAYPRLENPSRNPSYSIDFPWQDGCLTYESCKKQTSEREYNQNCFCLGQFLSHLPSSFALSEYRIREHRKNIGEKGYESNKITKFAAIRDGSQARKVKRRT